MPSASRTAAVSRPETSSRQTPPASPRLAMRKAPSGVIAIPLGRRSIVGGVARHVSVRPSARTTVTPPGHSGT
jgi:hypothetical protein